MAAIKLVVGTVGIASLVRDSWPTLLHWPSINLHAAFGVLLCGMVFVHFRQARLGSPLTSGHARALCRRLSHTVYLMLYVVFGAAQVVRMIVYLQNSGIQRTSIAAISQPPENLRDYLACGLLALIIIRALLALSVRRPPVRRMSSRWARIAVPR